MCNSAILERVKFLQAQVARIRAANQIYLGKRSRLPVDVEAQERREDRLLEILDELTRLNNKMKAA